MKISHGVRNKVNQILKLKRKMANQNMQYVQGPKMDWTEDAGLHQRFKDWREEVELLMDMVLSHIKNADTKMKFVTLWAGKEARTYLNTLEQDQRDSLKTILDSLEEWTKPKSDEIAAFTHLRTLNQGNKTLSSYIQEVRRVVDLCNFACVGDCKERLIRNSIVAGLSSTKAYQQCISKGSNLTLNEYVKQRMQLSDRCKLFDQSPQTAQTVHPYITLMNTPRCTPRQTSGAGEATEAPTEAGDPATEAAWEEPTPRETAGIVLRLHVATVVHGPTEQERNARLWAKSATTVVDLDTSQKCVDRDQTTKTMKRLQSNT